MAFIQLSWAFNLAVAAALIFGYTTLVAVYRIYLCPLAKIPGPKLAAFTGLYEAYYDLVRDGTFPWKIRGLHEKYGPVVRVNPREVHIQDPRFVDSLLLQKLDKDPWVSKSFGIPLSIFGVWQDRTHRRLRSAISRFFSKASIASRSKVVEDKVLKFCDRLEALHKNGEIVDLNAGFMSLTVDVISRFCYGASTEMLDVPGFDRDFKCLLEDLFGSGQFIRHVPFALPLMNALPLWVAKRLAPPVAGILQLQNTVRVQARRVMTAHGQGQKEPMTTSRAGEGTEEHKSSTWTIFDELLNSQLSSEEKGLENLVQEGQAMIAAGSETSSRVLSLSTVHLHKNPQLLSRLHAELLTVMPTLEAKPRVQELEQLPFLTAVIKESMRLGGSLAMRSARLSPSTPLIYKDWVFPTGTPVSVTLNDTLMDPNIFPDPKTFDPMRWVLEEQGEGVEASTRLIPNRSLDEYFVIFSRGPRSCIGMWLAWTEIYLTLAHMHRRFDLELYETDIDDIATARDRFSCFPKKESRGVRARIVGMRTV